MRKSLSTLAKPHSGAPGKEHWVSHRYGFWISGMEMACWRQLAKAERPPSGPEVPPMLGHEREGAPEPPTLILCAPTSFHQRDNDKGLSPRDFGLNPNCGVPGVPPNPLPPPHREDSASASKTGRAGVTQGRGPQMSGQGQRPRPTDLAELSYGQGTVPTGFPCTLSSSSIK